MAGRGVIAVLVKEQTIFSVRVTGIHSLLNPLNIHYQERDGKGESDSERVAQDKIPRIRERN